MKVIKRNGHIEELDISKIKKYTCEAIEGLNNVSQSELEVDAKIQFRDMITTEEIQKTLMLIFILQIIHLALLVIKSCAVFNKLIIKLY